MVARSTSHSGSERFCLDSLEVKMNCPGCGRFMELVFAVEIGRDVNQAAFWWACNNGNFCLVADRREYIPAPEYDWQYWCQDIPEEDLVEWPELRQECDEMEARWKQRKKSRKATG